MRSTQNIILTLSLMCIGHSATSDPLENESFDTDAFLNACTGLVPAGAFSAIPMDAACISQAYKMCNWVTLEDRLETCLLEVADWMRGEVEANWPSIPEEIRSGNSEPPSVDDMTEGGLLGSFHTLIPDCAGVKIDGVSPSALCEYTDALAGWHATRILWRSAQEEL